MFKLANLPKAKSKTKKRVGRGNASRGTYSGRGQKGQKSRSGGKGGLKRLGARDWVTKLPKSKGFKSQHRQPAWIEVRDLVTKFKSDVIITPGLLKQKKIIASISAGVKILGKGPLTKKIKVKGFLLSAGARQAIIKAGGEVIEPPKKDHTKSTADQKVSSTTKQSK